MFYCIQFLVIQLGFLKLAASWSPSLNVSVIWVPNYKRLQTVSARRIVESILIGNKSLTMVFFPQGVSDGKDKTLYMYSMPFASELSHGFSTLLSPMRNHQVRVPMCPASLSPSIEEMTVMVPFSLKRKKELSHGALIKRRNSWVMVCFSSKDEFAESWCLSHQTKQGVKVPFDFKTELGPLPNEVEELIQFSPCA